MFVFIFILIFIVSTAASSFIILRSVRDEIADTRREVVQLYAELRQELSKQQFQVEVLKRRIKKRSVTLGEVLEEPWVKELMEEE